MSATPASWVATRPTASPDTLRAALDRWWGVAGRLIELPSERDRNLRVERPDGPPLVLKIANLAEDPAFLACQADAMARLVAAGVPVARPVPALDGRTIVDLGDPGPPWARLMTWLPGRPLAEVESPGHVLLRNLGATMGRSATALLDFDHPTAHRALQWDVRSATDVIAADLADVPESDRRELLARVLDRLRARLVPAFPGLRHSVIHNDANDHNVLVDAAGERVVGLIDFGDLCASVTAQELAVALAYAMFHRPDALSALAPIVGGFDAVCPLTDRELDALPDLVTARIATSVAISAHQGRLDPDPYLRVSEGPGWRLLAHLEGLGPDRFRQAVRDAVGR